MVQVWITVLLSLLLCCEISLQIDGIWRPSVRSNLGNFSSAAVSIDSQICATIGKEVLERNGSAVDAAIAALFCNSLHQSSSMGPGGGLFMTIYQKSTKKVEILNARERAPLAATEDMFEGDPSLAKYGGLAIAVPGQIKGLWAAKQKYGNPNVSWESLIQPSIDLCILGIPISMTNHEALIGLRERIKKDPGMAEIFVNPKTGDVYHYDDYYTWPNLARTYEKIARNGADEFYFGETMELMLEDLQSFGSIITKEDFHQYEVEWVDPVSIDLGDGSTLYSSPAPGGGAILAYIMNILKRFQFSEEDLKDEALLYHRVAEALKWGYGHRSKLGDPFDENITEYVHDVMYNLTSDEYALHTYLMINDTFTVNNASYYGADFSTPDDFGTSHLSVLAPNGDAVSVTSTINRDFGAVVMSPKTGVIFNNEMDDFSSPNITNSFGVPPSPNNYIRPYKRPLSSTSPVIVVEKSTGDVKLVSGGSGGTKITTQTALVLLRNLWLDRNIQEATDDTRMHHQLAPMTLFHEPGWSQATIEGLEGRGHIVVETTAAAAINSIRRGEDGRIYANADFRKMGGIDGF